MQYFLCFTFLTIICEICGNSNYSPDVLDPISTDNPTEWFEIINSQWMVLNRKTAYYAWEINVKNDQSYVAQSRDFEVMKMNWVKLRCNELTRFNKYLTVDQFRMGSVMCSGPDFTEKEISELNEIVTRMQNLIADTKICLPASHDICSNTWILNNETYAAFPFDDKNWITYRINGLESILDDEHHPQKICFTGEEELDLIMRGNFTALTLNKCTVQSDIVFEWAWNSWRQAAGPAIGSVYGNLVNIMNQAAKRKGYSDIGVIWRQGLEIDNLRQTVNELWWDIKPFYEMLHGVVRFVLSEKYSHKYLQLKGTGLIPAHLLGSLWSDNWSLYAPTLTPWFNFSLDDAIKMRAWSGIDITKRADDFYSSLGFRFMNSKFWNNSYFDKTNTKRCHGTAANMFNGDDYRMVVCAKDSFDGMYEIVHEMGHILYYEQASEQPTLFQDGANAAFKESVGDALFLGFSTPQHLNRIGILPDNLMMDTKSDFFNIGASINDFDLSFLARMALAKVPQIPFALVLETFRWDLFAGAYDMDEANQAFWSMLQEEQGIYSVMSNFPNRFDPGAKFHVADNLPYISYFFSHILQFQIFKGLCEQTVFNKVNTGEKLPMPLHRCDIYGSKRAGKILQEALSLGSSRPWPEVLYILTGRRTIDAAALLEYYKPLIEWIRSVIRKNKIPIGWGQ